MISDEIMLKIENVSKVYKLGEIGGTTLKDELQRLKAKVLRKEDPTKKIGAKNYNKGEKFKALDNVSLEIKKGERVGIIGHNGAGKSTLLKLISRVTGPTDGKIYLNGRVTSMLEVGTGFHPELTGRENVYMNGAILGMTKKEIDAKIEEIIDFSEVRQFIDTPVKRYSSGMYVKLAFSVAAHLESEILIMDEVLAVGDMSFQNKCIEKMKNVSENDNRTVLYVSHNMNTIKRLCNRVIILKKGKIVFDGNVDDGIELYLNNETAHSEQFVDLSKIQRPVVSMNSTKMLSITWINRESPVYIRGENAILKISWKPIDVLDSVRFRIIIRSPSDEPVATTISKEISNITNTNSYLTTIALDTALLSEGKYILSIAMISKNADGLTTILDHVTRCSSFSVVENDALDDSVLDWNPMFWGYVHYPEIDILANEESQYE